MNDLELLKFASKASGMDYPEQGNPLDDDGDALRLAVKLEMNVYTGHKRASAEIISDSDEASICITMLHDNDPYAATRRAIVRAAADIGRGIK